MVTVKMLVQTASHQKKFNKEFKSINAFNEYKSNRLECNWKFVKYSIREESQVMYSLPVFEYGANKLIESKLNLDTKMYTSDNQQQQSSRNSQLALIGNKLINLNMTPAKQRSLVKWIESGVPITSKEVKTIKSLFNWSKITVGQYNLIEDIKLDVSRRKKVF
tara:strand:+ start:252 stop:740 length:489 start_codon:yes stop_codon:yes gene_type:complete